MLAVLPAWNDTIAVLEDVLFKEDDEGCEEGDTMNEDEDEGGEGGHVLNGIDYIRGPIS